MGKRSRLAVLCYCFPRRPPPVWAAKLNLKPVAVSRAPVVCVVRPVPARRWALQSPSAPAGDIPFNQYHSGTRCQFMALSSSPVPELRRASKPGFCGCRPPPPGVAGAAALCCVSVCAGQAAAYRDVSRCQRSVQLRCGQQSLQPALVSVSLVPGRQRTAAH